MTVRDLRESILRHGVRASGSYLKLLAGTSGRMVLQAVYFFFLANTLSLPAMGIFASASAAGLLIASFSGLGFGGLAFRAAAGRPRILGHYLALFYGSLAVTTVIGMLVALPVYYLLFRGAISLPAFAGIMLVEIALWRVVEVQQQINNGLGRYATGSIAITVASALRTGGAVLFALQGGGIEQWVVYYFASNAAALAAVWLLFNPAVPLRWRTRLLRARLRDGFMFALSYFALNAQGQVDKIIVLSLTDARFAGIYAISSRIVEFTAVPFRSFYTLYTRKLFREGTKAGNVLKQILTVEGAILVFSTAGFLLLIGLLQVWPNLLGRNIAAAAQLFAVMLLVPAFRNLLEFHGELFFVYGRMTARAAIATGLILVNMAALALLLLLTQDLFQVGVWLNLVYAGLYLLSAATIYYFITRQGRGR